MPTGNWFEQQPHHIRRFLVVTGSSALLLLVCLTLIVRRPADWVPDDTFTAGMLVPESADSLKRHFTPDSLTLRRPEKILPAPPAPANSLRWRVGVGLPDRNPLYFDWPSARPGWYLNWQANVSWAAGPFNLWRTPMLQLPDPRLGMEFVPMVDMRNGRLFPDPGTLRELASRYRGLTWLIGNEPDVRWQSNTTPEVYAIAYHRAYQAIKAGDPTAQVAIGGISQITPLRLAYLDRVWDFYRNFYGEELPVDVWNMHAFVLREERNSWGVNIPPGFTVEQHGMLWDVEEHDNPALVEQQVRDMRRWMSEHGQQDKPLWITEYGILMPVEYGFSPSRVIRFMKRSFDLFSGLRDPGVGYPADGYLLVQRWTWYPTRDSRYRAGNLFDDYGHVTLIGRALSEYIAGGGDLPQ